MSRAVKEWVATHDDQAIPPRVQLRLFAKGVCIKCGRKLRSGHWACDHIVALVNGGEHRESNLQPLCTSPCHSDKTKQDVAEKADVYAKRMRDVGVKKSGWTIPGRRFDGTPVPSRRRG